MSNSYKRRPGDIYYMRKNEILNFMAKNNSNNLDFACTNIKIEQKIITNTLSVHVTL